MAPPEHTARSGTASVLPPAPTVSSSRIRVNREPARDVSEKGDEDCCNEAEGKGKGRREDYSDEEGSKGRYHDEDYLDEDGDESEGESGEDEVADGEEVPPVMRFGPPKCVTRIEGDFFSHR